MGELVGSSMEFSTWGKFRAPFSNSENYYGMVLAAQNPSMVGSDHTKEFRAGRLCASGSSPYCYPPAYFVSEHGSMFRVIPSGGVGWYGANLFWQPYGYEIANGWWYGDKIVFYFYIDQRYHEQMTGAGLTWDSGSVIALQVEAFTSGQEYGYFDGTSGSGFTAIEKLKVIT